MHTAETIDSSFSSKKISLSDIPTKKLLPVIFICIIGIVLSVAMMFIIQSKVQSDNRIEFDKSVESITSRIENSLAIQEQTLKNLDGLFKASVQVVRDVFELYSTVPANAHPYIQSIGYSNSIEGKDAENFVYYTRSERFYDYRIHPEGNRPVFEPITYIVPFEKNAARSGFDLLSNPLYAKSVYNAHKNHGTIVSTPVMDILGNGTRGFSIMKAVSKTKKTASEPVDEFTVVNTSEIYDGMLFIEINADAFFQHVLVDSSGLDKKVYYQCFSKSSSNEVNTVYSSMNIPSDLNFSEASINITKTIEYGDQEFVLKFAAVNPNGVGLQRYLGIIALVTGLVTTFILCGFMLSVITSTIRAYELADKITGSNRRILESSHDMIVTFDLSGIWRGVNPALKDILGYEIHEVIGKHISHLLVGDGANTIFSHVVEQALDEQVVVHDVQMKTANGHTRWISWSLTFSKRDNAIYGIGRDVTEERIAAEQIKIKSKQVELAQNIALEANDFKSSFIMKISDNIKDSLQETLLKLHSISTNLDYEDARQLEFLTVANSSSDKLFEIVHDMMDIANTTTDGGLNIKTLGLANVLISTQNAMQAMNIPMPFLQQIGIHNQVRIKGDEDYLVKSFIQIFTAFSTDITSGAIEIHATENTHERVIEVQLIVPPSESVANMIRLYNKNGGDVSDVLGNDYENIMFRIACASSFLRRMGASISVETLDKEGNVALLTFIQGR